MPEGQTDPQSQADHNATAAEVLDDTQCHKCRGMKGLCENSETVQCHICDAISHIECADDPDDAAAAKKENGNWSCDFCCTNHFAPTSGDVVVDQVVEYPGETTGAMEARLAREAREAAALPEGQAAVIMQQVAAASRIAEVAAVAAGEIKVVGQESKVGAPFRKVCMACHMARKTVRFCRIQQGHFAPDWSVRRVEREVKCPLCGKAFLSAATLKGHLTKGCDAGTWRCQWCKCTLKQAHGRSPGPNGSGTVRVTPTNPAHSVCVRTPFPPSLLLLSWYRSPWFCRYVSRRSSAPVAVPVTAVAPPAPPHAIRTGGTSATRGAVGRSTTWRVSRAISARALVVRRH